MMSDPERLARPGVQCVELYTTAGGGVPVLPRAVMYWPRNKGTGGKSCQNTSDRVAPLVQALKVLWKISQRWTL